MATEKSNHLPLNFFLVFLTFLFLPTIFFKAPYEGLDISWQIAIHLAYKYHLVFGKDFVFTYGPLCLLVDRLPIAVNKFVYLAFDLYFLLTFFFILRDILKKQFGYGIVIFIFLSYFLAFSEMPDMIYFSYFLACLFAHVQKPSNRFFLIQAALLSLIGFYVKISDGIIEVILFLAAESYLFYRKKWSLKFYLLILVTYLAGMFISSRILHVSLINYWLADIHLITGYNDAMYITLGDQRIRYLFAAVTSISFFVLYALYSVGRSVQTRTIGKNMDQLFLVGIILAAIYVFFKAGFVRADEHILIYFNNAPLFAGLLFLYRPQNVPRHVATALCVLVLVCSLWTQEMLSPGEPYRQIVRFIPEKITGIVSYFRQFHEYDEAAAALKKLDKADTELKTIVGDGSVDVMPVEIHKVLFNGLRYNPRPVIQSYSAYTNYLDKLDSAKYISSGAPDFILYSTAPTDQRYAFFDDPKATLAILNHYSVAGQMDNRLLVLRKRETTRNYLKPVGTDTIDAKIGAEIPIPKSDKLQYSKIYISYSTQGRIKGFFFQAPSLQVTFTLDDGQSKTFRAVRSVLTEGVLVNKFIGDNDAFASWMKAHGRSNSNIVSMRFGPGPGDSLGFKEEIRLVNTYYAAEDRSDADKCEDNANAILFSRRCARYFARFKPTPADTISYEKGDIRYWIDNMQSDSGYIKIEGWAFKNNESNGAQTQLKIVLQGKEHTYELPAILRERKDIAAYYKRDDLISPGFSAFAGTGSLSPDSYRIGLSFLDKSGRRQIVYTDKVIPLNTDLAIEKVDSGHVLPEATVLERNSYYIDTIEEKGDHIHIHGWGYKKGMNSTQAVVHILFGNNESTFRLNTEKMKRKDVAEALKNPLIEDCGFTVLFPKRQLPAGVYKVGLEISFAGRKGSSSAFSDKTLVNEPCY